MTCSCVKDGSYPILGCIFLFNIHISFLSLSDTKMMYIINTCKIIIEVGWGQSLRHSYTKDKICQLTNLFKFKDLQTTK